jgi:hypothetical protein
MRETMVRLLSMGRRERPKEMTLGQAVEKEKKKKAVRKAWKMRTPKPVMAAVTEPTASMPLERACLLSVPALMRSQLTDQRTPS